jgi:hypothetical protein
MDDFRDAWDDLMEAYEDVRGVVDDHQEPGKGSGTGDGSKPSPPFYQQQQAEGLSPWILAVIGGLIFMVWRASKKRG